MLVILFNHVMTPFDGVALFAKFVNFKQIALKALLRWNFELEF